MGFNDRRSKYDTCVHPPKNILLHMWQLQHGSAHLLTFTRAEEAVEMLCRRGIGQSATWHNCLCFFFVIEKCYFCFLTFCTLHSDQRWTTLTFQGCMRKQSKTNCFKPFPPSPCSLPSLLELLFYLFGDWIWVCLFLCKCPFLCCHCCPWDLWVVCIPSPFWPSVVVIGDVCLETKLWYS